MASQELLDEISKLRGEKKPDTEIRNRLLKEGWSSEDITGALAFSSIPNVSAWGKIVRDQEISMKRPVSRSTFTATVLIVLILCAIGGGMFLHATGRQLSFKDLNAYIADLFPSTTPYDISTSTPANFKIPAATQVYIPSTNSRISISKADAEIQQGTIPTYSAQTYVTPTPSAPQVTTPPSENQSAQSSEPQASTPSQQQTTTPAPTLSFTSTSLNIPVGTAAVLSWSTTNASSCQGNGFTANGTSGSFEVAPQTTTTYNLICTGSGGSVTGSLTINVGGTSSSGSTSSNSSGSSSGSTGSISNPVGSPVTDGTYVVQAGCAVPSTSSGKTFYVDPVNGTAGGDGSQSKPWNSLSTVLAKQISSSGYNIPYDGSLKSINSSGAVHPGDTILLMSGNYGAVTVTGVNSDFITIKAASGQTPIFSSLMVEGADKWAISGVTVQSLQSSSNPYAYLVTIEKGYEGPSNNIIFANSIVRSTDNSSSWDQKAWEANAQGGIDLDGGTFPMTSGCISIDNNLVNNVLTGTALGIDNTLYTGNTINNFGEDAIDYDSNNLVISHNFITNPRYLPDENIHPDAMQGQFGRVNRSLQTAGFSNITIDSNKIIRVTDPSLPFLDGLQGIDGFQLNWTNMRVTNNVIITNMYQGISYGAIHNSLIANNSLAGDGGAPAPGSTYGGAIPWIQIGYSVSTALPANNTVVENNIANDIQEGTGTTFIDNVAGEFDITDSTGKTTYNHKAGVYGQGNILTPNAISDYAEVNQSSMQFNLHLLSTSPANGIATAANGAPTVDIDGNPRTTPLAAGAYASSYPTPSSVSLANTRKSLFASADTAFFELYEETKSFFRKF